MEQGLRNYLIVNVGYCAFTITDGAIRMLVLLYFHQLGYSPIEIAMLFLFYEFFGIVTNLVGGWLGSRIGLNMTMHLGMVLQIVALMALTVPDAWLSVIYVMAAQALSGIAKDLNKMSAKAGVKLFLPDHAEERLFRWIAILTGSKNAMKGFGFFVGAALLTWIDFRGALMALSGLLLLVLIWTWVKLPAELGKSSGKAKFSEVFSKSPQVNWLSAARFFLFGARDIWFVVGVPVFLQVSLGWSFTQVGAFLALWVIGYGVVQGGAPRLLRMISSAEVNGMTLTVWALLLFMVPLSIAGAMQQTWDLNLVLIIGLALFGIVFAINSAAHSYLIVSWSDRDRVSMNVGFYYMANAGGRLTGTIFSGGLYQLYGLQGCLYGAAIFALTAALISMKLK